MIVVSPLLTLSYHLENKVSVGHYLWTHAHYCMHPAAISWLRLCSRFITLICYSIFVFLSSLSG